MQTHENTEETGILLGKNSGVWINTHKVFESVSGEKLCEYRDALNLRQVGVDVNKDDSICTLAAEDCFMQIFGFIKSPDLDNELHYDFDKFYPNIEDILMRETIGYVSAHDDKVIRTSELVIYAKCDWENNGFDSKSFEKMTSQEKIKYLDDNGYRKLKLVCSEHGEGNNKLKLVDAENPATVVQQDIVENLGGVLRDNSTEYVTDDQFEGQIKWGMEFHLNNPRINSCMTYNLDYVKAAADNTKIVMLGQKTGFAFDDFYKQRNTWIHVLLSRMYNQFSIFDKPITFYIPFKGDALTDILSYCADNNIDHESLNITIAIMDPEICGGFQTIIDDIRNTTTVDQYLQAQKISKNQNCFVKFKLADLTKDNITKILDRQKNPNGTFENFINDVSHDSFCEITYQSKVARFLEKHLPNWLFKVLNWLFNFKKIKIGLQLTGESNLQKSISPVNNQENNTIKQPSNENNNRLVNNNESLNNKLPKEKNNLKESISPVNNQENNTINQPSNENNNCLVNDNQSLNNKLLKEKNDLKGSISPVNNQENNTIKQPSNENNNRLVNNNESLNNKLPKEKNNLKESISPVNNQNNSITNKSSNQYNIETPLLDKQGNDNII